MLGSERRSAEREIYELERQRLEAPTLPDARTLNIARILPMMSPLEFEVSVCARIADLLIAHPDARVKIDREAIAQTQATAAELGHVFPPLNRRETREEEREILTTYSPWSDAIRDLHNRRMQALGAAVIQ